MIYLYIQHLNQERSSKAASNSPSPLRLRVVGARKPQMDDNTLLNIVRHCDNSTTATAVLKAGGKALFDAAKAFDIIQEVTPTNDYYEVTYTCRSDIWPQGYIASRHTGFGATRIRCENCSSEIFCQKTRQHYCPACQECFRLETLQLLKDTPNKSRSIYMRVSFDETRENVNMKHITNDKKLFLRGINTMFRYSVTVTGIYQGIKSPPPQIPIYNNTLVDITSNMFGITLCPMPELMARFAAHYEERKKRMSIPE